MSRTTLVRLLLVALLALGLAGISAVAAPAAHADAPRIASFDNEMLALVNDARSDAGLPELQAATGLSNLSVWWSGQMASGATNNVLQHNPNAFQQTLSYGASNRTAWAENVAKWSPTSVTADAIFTAYMNSAGHKANILGAAYRFIGIGSVTGSNGASYNTMTFTDKVDPGQIAPPTGNLESVTAGAGGITVKGWALDQTALSKSLTVHVYVNGGATALASSVDRADVNAVFGVTGKHGFEGAVPAAAGSNRVCVYAIAVSGGENPLLGCQTVTWTPPAAPRGNLEDVSSTGQAVHIAGWAYDPNSTAKSIQVRVDIDGSVSALTADTARPDVNSAFGISGKHGYDLTTNLSAGNHQVCVWGDSSTGGGTIVLGCRTITVVPVSPPTGQLDGVTRNYNNVRVNGWALDPNATSTSVKVQVYVNGTGIVLDTNNARPDVNSYFGITGNHGFDATLGSATSGSVQVCAYAVSSTGGGNTLLGCKTV